MKRALISVYNKEKIVGFARVLRQQNWEIISTGGTFLHLKKHNISTLEISEYTGFRECLDNRVKTLHPKIEGGILAIRDNEQHLEEMQELGIGNIDLVVCNLYPFQQTVLNPASSHEDIISQIDIGGPTMLRAAAKNYKFVTVVYDTQDYEKVIDEIKQHKDTHIETRAYLATKIFQYTAHYEATIAPYFTKKFKANSSSTTFTFENGRSLRYGENPHQRAKQYFFTHKTQGTLKDAVQLHGKELSYNNISDADGALELLKEFSEPTIVAVKHANPCGTASAKDISSAFQKTYEADPLSIFGGIVASNREIDMHCAKKMKAIFLEIIIAPSYSDEALTILKKKKNIRLLQLANISEPYVGEKFKSIMGGVLVQDNDTILLDDDYRVVSHRKPLDSELEDLLFAWKVVKHTKSNAIILAKSKQTIGIGTGQVSRVRALEIAIEQAGEKAPKSVLASDAFFPFDDCLRLAQKAGITAVIQPGGSIRDNDSISVANEANIAMIFTGIRHFKH